MALGAMCGMAHTFLVHRKLYIHCKAEPFTSGNREAGFLPKDKEWRHEDASVMMFDDMIKQYDLDIPPDEVQFIKALIAGEDGEGFRCRSAFCSSSGSSHVYLCAVTRSRSCSRSLLTRGTASMWTSKFTVLP